MRPAQVRILDGSTFVVSDPDGDIDATGGEPTGLFFRDMRHLSRWQLLMNGRALDLLSSDTAGYDSALFFLAEATGTIYRNPTLSLVRSRTVGDGMHERLEVLNHATDPVRVELSVVFDADFADVFEVKDKQPKRGHVQRRLDRDGLTLVYQREDFVRQTVIVASGAHVTAGSLTFRLDIGPHEAWTGEVEVWVGSVAAPQRPKRHTGTGRPKPNMPLELDEWLADAPSLECDWDLLRHVYRRSLEDLAALRFYPQVRHDPSASLPAAGLPWFMALFGRDSVLTSYQTLPFVPELAATTLRALAARQASERDDFRDAEPGKVLHELRFGELTHFGERPQSPYYGSADVTPLFLVLLDEYERWTGDQRLVRDLEQPARAALRWVEQYGDLDGDGYIEYERRNTTSGLVNQCWKDSDNSIVHPDASLARLPRATCELQGYAYDARTRCARLARQVWGDDALARRLEGDAAALKHRFNRDFWVDDTQFFALALDGEKKQVTTVTSNPGHLLWSGIVEAGRAAAVAEKLMAEEMFSGWGVRTLADEQAAYNPIEYHNGTVWPHDNSLVAMGLARYGFTDQAARIATAVLEAAGHFDYRLPEAFAGYSRAATRFPVEYPTACSPQAWASGAPLLLLRVVLGLDPRPEGVTCDPHLPASFGSVRLRGMPGRWGRADVTARAHGTRGSR